MSDRNTAKAWSEFDLNGLRYCLVDGHSLGDIAEILCRDVDEVDAKAREMGWRGSGTLH